MSAHPAIIAALRAGACVRARPVVGPLAGEFCHALKGRRSAGFGDKYARAWAYARTGGSGFKVSGRVSRAQTREPLGFLGTSGAYMHARTRHSGQPLRFPNASRAYTYARDGRRAISAHIAGMCRRTPLRASRPEFLESLKRGQAAPAHCEFSESLKGRAAAAGAESVGARPSLHPRREP